MALHPLDNMLDKKGYVFLGKGVYLYGIVNEVGASGASGYYAILDGFSNGKQIKVGIFGENGLIQHCLPKGAIILGRK